MKIIENNSISELRARTYMKTFLREVLTVKTNSYATVCLKKRYEIVTLSRDGKPIEFFRKHFKLEKKKDTLEHLYRVCIIIIILYRSSARVILLEQDLYDTIINKKKPG